MNKELLDELLNEFWIKMYGNNIYTILPTDKAYELLGLKEKEIILPNGIMIDTINDWYYRVAYINFLSNNYRIDGLMRESRGNSHVDNWKREIYIFNEGGLWCNELNEYRTQEKGTYTDKPDIFDKKEITNEIIEEWAKEYDLNGCGEGERFVFCSYNDGCARMRFSFEYIGVPCTAAEESFSRKKNLGWRGCRIYLKEEKR